MMTTERLLVGLMLIPKAVVAILGWAGWVVVRLTRRRYKGYPANQPASVQPASRQAKAAPWPQPKGSSRRKAPFFPLGLIPRIMTTATPTRRCCTSALSRADDGRPTTATTTDPASLHSPTRQLASPICAPPSHRTARHLSLSLSLLRPRASHLSAAAAAAGKLARLGGFGRGEGEEGKGERARKATRKTRARSAAVC
nr:unnamed protein product [Digitaria exilis]